VSFIHIATGTHILCIVLSWSEKLRKWFWRRPRKNCSSTRLQWRHHQSMGRKIRHSRYGLRQPNLLRSERQTCLDSRGHLRKRRKVNLTPTKKTWSNIIRFFIKLQLLFYIFHHIFKDFIHSPIRINMHKPTIFFHPF